MGCRLELSPLLLGVCWLVFWLLFWEACSWPQFVLRLISVFPGLDPDLVGILISIDPFVVRMTLIGLSDLGVFLMGSLFSRESLF